MSVKRLDPNARFKLVCQTDEAVDRDDKEASDARYEKYLDNLDMNELKFKEGQQPSIFITRPLTNAELADINGKYLVIDAEKKTAGYKDQIRMFMEMFDKCVIGIQEGPEGTIEQIKSDELPYTVAGEIGSQISVIATLGKNLKKA